MPSADIINGHLMNQNPPSDGGLIGCRVSVNDEFATIRWVGCLPGISGEWYGLEWDDFTRGRHDGSHNGHRYFETKNAKGGSFVRPAKVSFGISLKEAIDRRYGEQLDELLAITDEDLRLTNSQTVIELVGIDKIATGNQEYGQLTSLYLHGQAISHSSPGMGVNFPKVKELNVGQCLLSDWVELGRICSEFPLLSNLTISDNHLLMPPPLDTEEGQKAEALLSKAFANVEHLVAVRLGSKWTDLCRILRWFPRLKHLCAAYNCIEGVLKLPDGLFQDLTYLDLGINPIADWTSLQSLALNAPKLKSLLLTECGITDIRFPDAPDFSSTTSWFPSLELLSVYGNRLSSWASIDELSKLKKMTELMVSENPVTSGLDRQTSRQMVIARLGRLKILNRNDIDAEERRGAEIDYLKLHGKTWAASYGLPDGEAPPPKENGERPDPPTGCEFLQEHPRYMTLVRKYGASEKAEYSERSRALKSGLLRLHIVVERDGGGRDCGDKQFPLRMTVRHLKTALRRHARAPSAAKLSLWYSSTKVPGMEYELDADTREIGFYTMDNDDTLKIRW